MLSQTALHLLLHHLSCFLFTHEAPAPSRAVFVNRALEGGNHSELRSSGQGPSLMQLDASIGRGRGRGMSFCEHTVKGPSEDTSRP